MGIFAVAKGDAGEVGAAELTGALAHALERRVQIEDGGEAPRDIVQDLGLAPSLFSLAVEPCVLEGEGGLIGEDLQDADVGLGEHAPELVGNDERPGDLALDPEGNTQERAGAGELEPAAVLLRHSDRWVGQDVGHPDRSAPVRGLARHTGPRGERSLAVGAGGESATPGDRLERSVRQPTPQAGKRAAKKGEHSVDDASPDLGLVEALGQTARNGGQGLGLPPALLCLAEEPRVLDGERSVGGEEADVLSFLLRGLGAAGKRDVENAEHLIPIGERHDV